MELNYTEDKDVLNKIFTLLNCLEGYNNDKGIFYEHFRYRFDIHNKYNWSIEHIIPQKPDDKTILVYFNDIINYFKEYNNDTDEKVIKLKEINKKIEIKLSEPEYEEFKESIEKLILSNNDKLKEAFVEDLKKYLPNFNDFIGIHNIKNLALLDKDTNSSLQNLPFKEKRNELLKSINDNGVFIPALTLKVFSKTFKGANAEGMYWTPKDFDKYEEYQEKKLKGFINSIEKRGNNNE